MSLDYLRVDKTPISIDYFKEHWDEMREKDIIDFICQHEGDAKLNETFLREYKDVLDISNIFLNTTFKTNYSKNFLREFIKESRVCFSGRDWDEKTIEEFKNQVFWDIIFEANFDVSKEFLNKHEDRVRDVASAEKRREYNFNNNIR